MASSARTALNASLSTALADGSNITATELRQSLGSVLNYAEALMPPGDGGGSGSFQVVNTSQAGCISDATLGLNSFSTGTDNTAALQSILDRALDGPLLVLWDGSYSTTGLNVHSNTRIVALPGCGAILRNGSERPLMMNAAPRIGLPSTWVSENISTLDGVWHGNRTNQSKKGGTTYGLVTVFSWHGVRNLNQEGAKIYGAKTYAINAMGVANASFTRGVIDVGNVSGITNSDGIHVGGNSDNVVIRDWWANCGDDAFVGTASDNYASPYYGSNGDGQISTGTVYANAGGPINGLTIQNCIVNAQLGAVRLLSAGNPMTNVVVDSITGTTCNYWLCIDNFQFVDPSTMVAPGPGSFGKIRVTNCHVTVTNGPVGYYLRRARAMISANIKHLILDSITRTDFGVANHCDFLLYGKQGGNDLYGYPTNVQGGGAAPVIDRLTMLNYNGVQTSGTTTDTPVVWNDGANVKLLELVNCTNVSEMAVGQKPLYLQTAGNVEDLQINGAKVIGISRVATFLGGTVGGLSVAGLLHKGTSDYSFVSTGVTIPEIVASNFRGNRGKIVNSNTLFPLRSGDAFASTDSGNTTPPPTGGGAALTISLAAAPNPLTMPQSGNGTMILTPTISGGTTPAKVEYFLNGSGSPFATVTTGSFAYAWELAAGTNGAYSVTAKATDTAGATATSSAVQVTINPPSTSTGNGSASTLTVTASPNPLTMPASGNGSITLTPAITGNETITSVDYFLALPDGAERVIGTATSSPFVYNWVVSPSPDLEGPFTLKARLHTATGGVATSPGTPIYIGPEHPIYRPDGGVVTLDSLWGHSNGPDGDLFYYSFSGNQNPEASILDSSKVTGFNRLEVFATCGGSGMDFDLIVNGDIVASGTTYDPIANGVTNVKVVASYPLSPANAYTVRMVGKNYDSPSGRINLFFNYFRGTKPMPA